MNVTKDDKWWSGIEEAIACFKHFFVGTEKFTRIFPSKYKAMHEDVNGFL
jgi:hypothetical protein